MSITFHFTDSGSSPTIDRVFLKLLFLISIVFNNLIFWSILCFFFFFFFLYFIHIYTYIFHTLINFKFQIQLISFVVVAAVVTKQEYHVLRAIAFDKT